MNEEFAINLKLVLDDSSVSHVQNVVNNIQSECENLTTKAGKSGVIQMFDLEEPTAYSARLQLLKFQIEDIMETINAIQEAPAAWGDNYQITLLKLQAELEKLIEQYNRLVEKERESGEEAEETAVKTSNIGRNLKNLLLGIVGIRSAYSAIHRAMSTYLSQNTELQQKITACWYALGSLLAPILEYIVNLFVKIVGFVDKLLKALGFAGINMSKFGKNTAKANKEVQKQLAGFDEINNLTKEQAGGSDDGGVNPFDTDLFGDKWQAFFDFIKLNAEMLKIIGIGAMFGIGVAMLFTGHPAIGLGMIVASGVLGYKYFSENWDYIVEKVGGVKNIILGLIAGFEIGMGLILLGSPKTIPLGIGLLAAGLGTAAAVLNWEEVPEKVRQIMGELMTIIGVSMAAIGLILFLTTKNPKWLLMALGGGAMAYGGAQIDTSWFKEWTDGFFKKTKETTDKIKKNWSEAWKNIGKRAQDRLKEMREYLSETSLAAAANWQELAKKAGERYEEIKATIKDKIKTAFSDAKTNASEAFQNIVTSFSGIGTKFSEIKKSISDNLTGAFSKIKKDAETAYSNMVNAFNNAGSKFESIAKTIKSKLESAFSTLKTTAQTAWNNAASVFDNNSSMASKIINFFKNINATISPQVKLPDITGYVNGGQIQWQVTGGQVLVMYDKGTNYVPNDQLALLHKGEAVIPAGYNQQGSPFVGNDETNDLLREFMNLVNNKDFKAVISQREVGQASVDYIHQQSRIMGGSIV